MRKFPAKFNIFLSALLLVGATFSYVTVSRATTPNPGHAWSEVGDGIFAVTGPTALRTFTFPDASATVMTGNGILKGGIITGTGADTFGITAAGADGEVLSADSSAVGGVRWIPASASSGTVTSVSVVTANGISGSVSSPTTTPAITLTLGNITPSTVNGITFSGSSSPTLSVSGTASISGTSAGTNTGDQTSVTGNAGTATALQNARNINGVSFNGTADITVTAAAGTLTGSTLNSTVLNSSLTSVGTLTNLTVASLAGGGVQCVRVNNAGQLSGAGADCGTSGGGGTTPGGSDKNIQYNDAGVFGGDTGFIRDITNATNRYGLKVAEVTGGTNNWSIWSGDTATTDVLGENDVISNVFVTNSLRSDGEGNLYSVIDKASGAIAVVIGTTSVASTSGTGSSTDLIGSDNYTLKSGSGGTTNNATAVQSNIAASVGTITNAYGFLATSNSVSGSGAITNNYGLSIQDQTAGTTNYAIYTGLGKVSLGDALQFRGSSSGVITMQTQAAAGTYNFNLPTTAGTAGQVLTSQGGAGTAMTWTTPTTGTVTAVSVASANGFAGTSSGGATPILTLSTTITGILSGNGTSISAASTTGSGAVVLATSPTLVTPNLGTPSTLVGTNITGTAAGLTAGNVTTNANMTGAITSVGNATSLGSFTTSALNTALSDNDVATLAGSETLTNKTLTSPTIAKIGNLTTNGFVKTSGSDGTLSIDTNTYLTSSTGVSSITGTANQVIASAATGAVTLSTPQDIATTSTPTFAGLTVTSSNTTQSTTSSALVLNANSLTTGTGFYAASSSLTGGKLVDLQVSGTAAAASQTALNILTTGATATNAITTYGAQISNTHTNATSGTNVGLLLNASGATSANYALITSAGNVGIGNATPAAMVDITTASTVDAGGYNTGVRIANASVAGSAANSAFVSLESIGTNLSPYYQMVGSGRVWRFRLNGSNSGEFNLSTATSVGGSYTTAINISTGQKVTVGPSSANNTANAFAVTGNASIGSSYVATSAPTNGLLVEGNVGIGDTTPASALTVGSGDLFQVNSSGVIAAAAGITSSGTITFSGLSSAGIVHNTSGGVLSTSAVSLTADVTGTLPVANGGTGQTTYTNGQLLIGNSTGNTLTKATLTGTTNQVVVTNGGGSITLSTPQDIATTSTPTFAGLTVTSSNTTQSTTSSALVLNANSLTTGTGFYAASSTLSSGKLIDLQVSGTAAASNTQTALNIATAGANTTTTQTTYGAQIANTHTGTSSTNVGLSVSASGATNNYGLLVPSGSVGIGTSAPTASLHVNSLAVTGTREYLIKGQVSDSGNDAFYVSNGINTDSSFLPTFGGIVESNSSSPALTFQSFVTSGNDASNSGPLMRFISSRTSSATDPINGSLTAVVSRDLFAFSTRNSGGSVATISTFGANQSFNLIPFARTTGTPSVFTVTSPADTGLTANTEVAGVNFNLSATKQFSTVTTSFPLQREFLIQAPTYGFVGASTLADAATVGITGAPVKGTNATLTNTHALLISAGAVSTATNSYGLTVNTQTGATNNYAAEFLGGKVGIGDSTPLALLTVGSGDLFQVNSSGAIAAAAGITSSGTITFSGLSSAGVVHNNSSGVLSTSAVSLTSDISGILSPANGGTGVANNAASTITISGNFGTTITVTGTTTVTLPTSGTLYGTATGSITSAQLATSLTDETGTGVAVFSTSPTLSVSGAQTTATNGATITNTATSSTNSIDKIGLSLTSTGTWSGSGANNYALKIADATGGTNNWNIYSGPDVASFNGATGAGFYSTGANQFGLINKSASQPMVISLINEDNTLDDTYGILGVVTSNNSSGTKVNSVGADVDMDHIGAGNVGNMVAFTSTLSLDGSGNVTNAVEFDAQSIGDAGAGSITNTYGLRVADQTAGINNWNIWSGDTTVPWDPYDDIHQAKVIFNENSAGTQNSGVFAINNWSAAGTGGNALSGSFRTSGTGGASDNSFGVSGLLGSVLHGGSGTIADANGISSYVETQNGDITNAVGVHVNDNSASVGTITNNYGLKVEDQDAGTNNWNIFSGDTTVSGIAGYPAANMFVSTTTDVGAIGFINQSSGSGIAIGLLGIGDSGASGANNGSIGAELDAFYSGSGTAVEVSGVYTDVGNGSTGAVTNMMGIHVTTNSNFGGGSITNNYGLKVEDQTAGTTNYAIYTGLGKVSLGDALQFRGSSSGVITMQTQAAAGTYNFNLPTTAGTAGQVLTSQGGAGTAMTWTTPTTGTVTAVSVASANGFAGTSSGGATPILTLSTTITGLLKGNGTAISAATPGTDYLTPTGSGAGLSNVVNSITGTANQVIASAATGAVTLSLPQSIATTSTPQFARLGLGTAADANDILTLSGSYASGIHGTLTSNAYATGNTANINAVNGLLFITNATGTASGTAFEGDVEISGAGNQDGAIGVYTSFNKTGAGVTDNTYGAFLAGGVITAGTINTNYGLYVEDQTIGTTNYNIYSGSSPGSLSDQFGLFTPGSFNWGNALVSNDGGHKDGAPLLAYLETSTTDGMTSGINSTAISKNATGTRPLLSGAYSTVTQGGAGTLTDALAIESQVTTSAGIITNAVANKIDANAVSGTGAITNNYGLKIDDQTVGTYNYNIWSGPSTVSFSDPYDGRHALNVFNGNDVSIRSVNGDGEGASLAAISNVTSANPNGVATGLHGAATSTGNQNVAALAGIAGESFHQSSGLLTNQSGVVGYIENTGPVTNAVVFDATQPIVTSSTIDNAYGLKVANQTAGTNNWNIYSGDSANDPGGYFGGYAKNFFSRKNDGDTAGGNYSQTLAGLFEQTTVGTEPVGGLLGVADINGSGNAALGVGVEGDAFFASPGLTLPSAWGVTSYVQTTDGTITDASSIYDQGVHADGGNITNGYGLYLEPNLATAGGAITNSYGLYISSQTAGANNYALYTNTGKVSLGDGLQFRGSSSGVVTLQAAAAAGTWSLTLPTSAGSNGQFLQTNGSGVATWVTAITSAAGGDKAVQFNDGGTNLGGSAQFTFDKTTGTLALAPTARTSGSPSILTVTAPADTTLAAGTESTSVNFDFATNTRQFAAGAITTQREFRVQAPTYRFVSASTITSASTMEIGGFPIAGTNATITGASALSFGAAPRANATSVLVNLGNVNLSGGSSNGTYLGTNPASFTGNFVDFQIGGTSKFKVDNAGTITTPGNLSLTSPNTSQTTTSSVIALNANSLSSGTGLYAASSTLSSGKLIDLQVSGTAAAASQTALNILTAGANASNAITTYGAQISNTHTNATSGTNVGLYINASGATTANYGLIVNAGSVGIGTTTPAAQLDVSTASTQFLTTGDTVTVTRATNVCAGCATEVDFIRSRGTSLASKSVVQSGDTLGGFYFRGYDGSANQIAAAFSGGVDATPGSADMPGFLTFSTSPDGSGTPVERLRINNAGNVGLGIAAPTSLLHVVGTAPSSNTGNGIAATTALTITGSAGGASSGTTGQTGGTGAGAAITGGAGGAVAGASGIGGSGGVITLTSGAGGAGATTNGSGGLITLQGGAAGAGAGTGGSRGNISLQASGGFVGIGTSSPTTLLELGSSDLGNGSAGPVLTLGRNTNGTATGAGSINFLQKGGTAGYVWQDAAGKLRINTSAPSNANDTSGTVVGDQTSTRDTKQDIADYNSYDTALQMVLDAPLHTFRYKKEVAGYGSDSPLAKTRIGYIADEVSPAFMVGNSIDQVSVNGILMASIKELNLKINTLSSDQLFGDSPTAVTFARDLFADVITNVEDGVAYMKGLVVETLKIGSPEKRTGITLYDEATGDPYCLSIKNGQTKTAPGECPIITPDEQTPAPTQEPAPTTDPTPTDPTTPTDNQEESTDVPPASSDTTSTSGDQNNTNDTGGTSDSSPTDSGETAQDNSASTNTTTTESSTPAAASSDGADSSSTTSSTSTASSSSTSTGDGGAGGGAASTP